MKAPALLRYLRITLSTAVLTLFVAGVLFGEKIASDAIAFGQLVPSLLRWRQLILGGTASALFVFPLILAATLLVGRGYCSSLCPLGTLQDLVFAATRRSRRTHLSFQKPRNWLRAIVAALAAALWLGGSTLLFGLLEPYTIAHRGFASSLNLIQARPPERPSLASLPGAAAPESLGPPSDRELPRRVDDLAASLPGLLILLAVLATAGPKARLFCNTLCPAGTLLSAPACLSLLRIRIDTEACTACGRCSRVCPARCIDAANRRVYAGSCVLCFDCLAVCPVDAISYSCRARRP